MDKINKELTREFLQTKGIKFMGSYWGSENCTFQLTATDKENIWMVYVPEIPVGYNQPEPIHDYNGLLLLYLQQFTGYLKKNQNTKLVGVDQNVPDIIGAMSRYFDFDKNLSFEVALSQFGVQLRPGNEYTLTAMAGEESRFKVEYSYNGSEPIYFEFSINRQCVSKSYIESLISNELHIEQKEIHILSVMEYVKDNYVIFFGAGFQTNLK